MAKEANSFWCAVRNLDKPSDPVKVLRASDLYRIKESRCFHFKPKLGCKLDKHEEFGVIDGLNLVKHVVLRMSGKLLVSNGALRLEESEGCLSSSLSLPSSHLFSVINVCTLIIAVPQIRSMCFRVRNPNNHFHIIIPILFHSS